MYFFLTEVVVAAIASLITRLWVGYKWSKWPEVIDGCLMIGFHDGEIITWMSTDLSVNDLVERDHIVLGIKDVREDDVSTYSKV